jgi:hypothetical protein
VSGGESGGLRRMRIHARSYHQHQGELGRQPAIHRLPDFVPSLRSFQVAHSDGCEDLVDDMLARLSSVPLDESRSNLLEVVVV